MTTMTNKPKNPKVALILSFFVTGLGQIYNGQIFKGILLFCIMCICGGLMFFLIGFLLYPLVWIYGVWDAYTVAKRRNEAIAG
jgi:TM2 domain-containing membrane protein YozV